MTMVKTQIEIEGAKDVAQPAGLARACDGPSSARYRAYCPGDGPGWHRYQRSR